MQEYQEIIKVLPKRFRTIFQTEISLDGVTELRIRIGKPIYVKIGKKDMVIKEGQAEYIVSKEDISEISQHISGYSIYAFEKEIKNGFLTLKGGHRVGIAGEIVMEQGEIKTIKNFSSFNIRISRQMLGCADVLMPYINGNVLIISPPGLGKTTLLRDMLRQLSNRQGECVGVVDERSEIGNSYRGEIQNDLGARTDILDGCPKAQGMLMLLRSMSPTVIGVDELGSKEDMDAVLRVVNCGVHLIATVHGESIEELQKKSVFAPVFSDRLFHTYILIEEENRQKKYKIYNRELCMVKGIEK